MTRYDIMALAASYITLNTVVPFLMGRVDLPYEDAQAAARHGVPLIEGALHGMVLKRMLYAEPPLYETDNVELIAAAGSAGLSYLLFNGFYTLGKGADKLL